MKLNSDKNKSVVSDYLALAKVRLLSLVVISTAMGFYLSSVTGFNLVSFGSILLGVTLVGGGANALNQWYERNVDTLMRRTSRRPLPDNRLQPNQALAFGLLISFAGFMIIALGVNSLSLLLSFLSWASYLFLYTPLKRKSVLNTWLGAIPGALPAMLGCTAAMGVIDARAGCLFFILYFWQMPHFFAISWVYKEDYSKGGFKMLSLWDKNGGVVSFHILIHTALMALASVALFALSVAGGAYLIGAVISGLASLWVAVRFYYSRSIKNARQVFKMSLYYLPILFLSLILDRFL